MNYDKSRFQERIAESAYGASIQTVNPYDKEHLQVLMEAKILSGPWHGVALQRMQAWLRGLVNHTSALVEMTVEADKLELK